jgi:hypothetical protein
MLLLADDDEKGAFLTQRALAEAGIDERIVLARDGEAVIAWLSGGAEVPRLALLD